MKDNTRKTVKVFSHLGNVLGEYLSKVGNSGELPVSTQMERKISNALIEAGKENPWFTRSFLIYSLKSWSELLVDNKVEDWLGRYPEIDRKNKEVKNIGLVLAGNLPLVGLHDVLCVLASGNRVISKLSSRDRKLYPIIRDILYEKDPGIADRWSLLDSARLEGFEAVIATGSDNSSRYFEYYFGKYPGIIRKNRNSVAILDGNETRKDMQNLADDIFLYFGLGCRSISKLYVPEVFTPDKFYEGMEHYSHLYNHHKYANNYDYRKAVFLVNRVKFYDNGFLILKEDPALSSHVACIHYEYYSGQKELDEKIAGESDKIQCIAGRNTDKNHYTQFGQTQKPDLSEYADNIDTLKFLLNL